MRTLILPLLGLFLTSSSWAEEAGEVSNDRPKIGVLVLETTPDVKITDALSEVMVSFLGGQSGGGVEIVGPEELRGAIAPGTKNRGQENADIRNCLSKPSCLAPAIVQMDLALLGVGTLGQTGKHEYRIQFVFYDVFGADVARDDFKLRGKDEEVLAASFPSIAKVLGTITTTIEFTVPKDAAVSLNGKPVQVTRLAFMKPDLYQIKVVRPNCKDWAQSVDAKAGTVNTIAVTEAECVPWVPPKVAELREQGLHYTRLSPPNWQVARAKLEEAVQAGGQEDPKLWYNLAKVCHELRQLDCAFKAAEHGMQVTPRPSAKADIAQAEEFLRDVLHKWYGRVIVKLDEAATAKTGYIHLRDKGGLINTDKKVVFQEAQQRFAKVPVTLDREGALIFLPFGVYKANGVPFTVEPGKVPEVEVFLEAKPPPPSEEKKPVPLSVWATGGTAVAALVAGVAFHIATFGKADEYAAATTERVAMQARDDGERLQFLSSISYAVGVGMAGGAILLYALGHGDAAAEQAVQVAPTPGGVVAVVRF